MAKIQALVVYRLHFLVAASLILLSVGVRAQNQSASSAADTLNDDQKRIINELRHIIDFNNLDAPGKAIPIIETLEKEIDNIDLSAYWSNTGNTYFIQQNYLEAAFRYRSALQPDKRNYYIPKQYAEIYKRGSWINLGSAYQSMNMYDSALACYQRTPVRDDNRLLLANNIATIYMNQDDFASAITYLENLSLDYDLEKYKSDRLGVQFTNEQNYVALVRHNRMICHAMLGDLEQARQYYSNSYLALMPYGDTIAALKSELNYYILTNDTARFEKLYHDYFDIVNREVAIAANQFSLTNSFGAGSFLRLQNMVWSKNRNNRLFRDGWNYWKAVLREMPKSKSASGTQRLGYWTNLSNTTKVIVVLVVLLTSTLLYFLGFGAAQLMGIRKAQKLESFVAKQISVLEVGTTQNDPFTAFNETELSFVSSLSLKEAQVLRHTIQGLNPKEISEKLGCSSGYVYNMKSALRKNYEDFFDNNEFDEWLKKKCLGL